MVSKTLKKSTSNKLISFRAPFHERRKKKKASQTSANSARVRKVVAQSCETGGEGTHHPPPSLITVRLNGRAHRQRATLDETS